MIEQRKARRFELELPFEIVRAGATTAKRCGTTKNLSSSGVLLTLGSQMSIGESVEYFITLPTGQNGDPPVRLRCVGKVVRNQPEAVAATLERYEFIREHRD